jgi:hypothetical protein
MGRLVNKRWNCQPPGYRRLERNEPIQSGDVIKMHDAYYSEYLKGMLIGKLPGCPNSWFRAEQKT